VTPDELVRKIRDDRAHGASELACQCLAGLADHARSARARNASLLTVQLVALAHRLQQARPAMAPITNLINHWLTAVEKESADDLEVVRQQAIGNAQWLIAESRQAVSKAASHAAALIGANKTIMTHSLSSTVVAVFELLTPHARAIVTESRPPAEGRRLAKALSELGITTDFITDQQMGLFVPHADVILVGADTVAAEGSVVNKAGTYLLALAASEQGIPFYACFESCKRSRFAPADIVLERHDPDEYDAPRLPNVTSHNVYFDVTPPSLVTAWITELGVSRERGLSA